MTDNEAVETTRVEGRTNERFEGRIQSKLMESEERPKLTLGDAVTDREKEDGTKMLVTGLPLEDADAFTAKGKTIAEHNPSYPADDAVIKIKYPTAADVELGPLQEFAFPRSRLKLEHRFSDHGDRDEK
ncbi:hypothetical protein [Halomontanus rarus]|uniref:hypothetical protein n=1 Tax=Halomontanus rarus TaxID=3034020 RepID=UPI0023E793ED|nr:hypothetical protein [Halovivax sp. TS33]